MKKHQIILVFIILILVLCSVFTRAQLPIGTVRKPIVTDNSGNVITTPIVFSNQVNMAVAATTNNQLVRFQEFTNNASVVSSITNTTDNVPYLDLTTSLKVATLSTNSTKIALNIFSDNNASGMTNFPSNIVQTNSPTQSLSISNLTFTGFLKVGTVTGFTGSVTNNGTGSTNITVYSNGVVTNNFRTP